jgi:protein-L-isoaspartate(D-aspartate) O-methyltransferase
MNVEQARFNMIEQQIRPWDVLEPGVLALLARVRREDFVPAAHQTLAFVDTQVPLLEGAPQGTCMLEPRVEARMLQELRLEPSDRVLEIGTGSGFMACLLAGLAGDVTSLEINETLADQARENLRRAGVDNVRVLLADGSAPDHGQRIARPARHLRIVEIHTIGGRREREPLRTGGQGDARAL